MLKLCAFDSLEATASNADRTHVALEVLKEAEALAEIPTTSLVSEAPGGTLERRV